MNVCHKCGASLDEGEKFCYQCGTEVIHHAFCTQCGTKLREGAAFWSACGQPCTAGHSAALHSMQQEVSDKWAWTLATAPLSAEIVLGSTYLIGGVLLTVLIIALNCIFFILDKKELESKGNQPENWIWLGLFLVPVYLFMRASKVGKKYGYAITWCGLFLLSLLV